MPRPSEWFNRPFNAWTWPMIVLTAFVLLVIGGVVLSLVLAGCAAQGGTRGTSESDGFVNSSTSTHGMEERRISLSDGRTITCITWSDHSLLTENTSSGISCDWGKETQ
jgi:hypothetical protein